LVNLNVPVATATPLLDYTIRHRNDIKKQEKEIRKYYEKNTQYYDWKLENLHNKRRLERAFQYKHDIEAIHQYEVLKKQRDYGDYRYLFYVGTKVDIYI